MNSTKRRLGRLARGVTAFAVAAGSSFALSSSPAQAAPGDVWDVTGRAAGTDGISGSTGGSTFINGYGVSTGMGVFELTNQNSGEVSYAFCIEPDVTHEDPGNIESGANQIASAELDYLSFKYANPSVTTEEAVAAQALAWYYVGGQRSSPAVPVWYDTLNNVDVTPFSPDPWNALPTFGYSSPQKPVGFQGNGFDNNAAEVAVYNIAVDVAANKGPWLANATNVDGEIYVSGPGDPILNPTGSIAGAEVEWMSGGSVVATSFTGANGLAQDPTGTADMARIRAPGTHREAQINDSQLLGIRPVTTLLMVDVQSQSQPDVSTQISHTLALAGDVISDSVILEGMEGTATATVQLQLFNLTDDPSGSGTPLVDVTVPGLTNGTVSGLAPYTVTFADAGDQLGYRERIVSTSDGVGVGPWSDLGIASETTPVGISNPSTFTVISTNLAVAGQTIFDSITISGLVGGATADVQFQLFNLADDPTGAGTPLVDVTVTGLGNGTSSNHAPYVVTFADAGDQLGYRERIVSTSDGVTTDWSQLGISNETTPVDISEPVVSTNISTQLAVAGQTVTDSITISGLIGGATADVQLQLFNLDDDPNGTGTPLVDVTVSGLTNGTVSGIAPYLVTFADAGDQLGYRERVVSTSDGVTTGWSTLGIPSETTPVDISEPVVVTQISDQDTVAGNVLTDSVTITGLVGGALADIQLQLFNLADDPNGTGTPLVDVTIPNLGNGTHSGFGTYTITFADAGDQLGYRERVVSTSDGVTTGWSTLGIANETTTVDISEPVVVTQISDQEVFAGETITDSITLTGMVGGALADVQLQLFNLTDDPNGTGTPLVDVLIEDLDNGTHSGFGSYLVTLEDAGDQLGYRERVVSTSDSVTTEWSALGIVNETTDVLPQPKVITNISTTAVEHGSTITDSVSVLDVAEHLGESVTIEVSLYDITLDATCSSPLTVETITVSSDGTVTGVAPYTVLRSQRGHTLGYVEQIVGSSDPLRISDEEWSPSECGAVSESTFVAETATLVTTASNSEDLVIFGNLVDSYTAEVVSFDNDGNVVTTPTVMPAETVEVTASLYGPFANVTESGFLCSPDNLVQTMVVPGVGSGSTVITFDQVTEYGVYTFSVDAVSETIANRDIGHGCGIAVESFVHNPDMEIDTQTDGLVIIGESSVEVSDVVSIANTGIDLDGEDTNWAGEVALYGPYTSLSAATCDAADMVGSPSAISGVGEVTDLTVDGFQVSEPGVYTFVASVERLLDNSTASHPCGVVSESFTALAPHAVVTAVSDAEALLDSPVSDIATIVDMGVELDGTGQAWTAQTIAYGPFVSLADAVCSADTAVASVTFAGNGSGEFTSPAVTPAAPGMYTFVTTVTRVIDGSTATHDCGLEAESFRVTFPMSVDTQASSNMITLLGESLEVADEVTVTGMSDSFAWTGEVTLYGPFETMSSVTCSADTALQTVEISGSGDSSVLSPAVAISESGVYTFVATVTRTVDGSVATHDCGLAAETVEASYPDAGVDTQASSNMITLLGNALEVADEVTVTGMGNSLAWTGEVTLYGPFESIASAVCSTDTAVRTVEISGSGNATVTSPAIAINSSGVYTFVATVTRTVDGSVATHDCGLAAETVDASYPAIGIDTQTVNALILLEGQSVTVTDQVIVSGMGESLAWTGEVTLYGPFENIALPLCSADTAVQTVEISGSGNATVTSPGIEISTGGVYTFVATVTRTVDGSVVTHDCGLLAETVTVTVEVPELPATGGNSRNAMSLAVGLAAAGFAMIATGRRRGITD